MRNYSNVDRYLDKLLEDIYPQPQDSGHTSWAREAIKFFVDRTYGVNNVLDLGCGEGFCESIFREFGILEYWGIAFGEDVLKSKEFGRHVKEADFSFLPLPDGSVDLLFSRHSLEHSPFPLITLMEWHRVSSKYLALVLPDPSYWTYSGNNHYFVLNKEQWVNLFEVSGWKVVESENKSSIMALEENSPEVNIEFWFLLEKNEEITN